MRKLIALLFLTGCVTMSDHPPQKRPDFSKSKEERDSKPKGCGGCGCSSPVSTATVAPVKS